MENNTIVNINKKRFEKIESNISDMTLDIHGLKLGLIAINTRMDAVDQRLTAIDEKSYSMEVKLDRILNQLEIIQ